MQLYEDVSLTNHSTMRLGGTAKYLSIIDDVADLKDVVAWAKQYEQPILVVGQGSNIVFRDSAFDGLVIVMKIPGFEAMSENKTSKTYKVGAGEIWDSVVSRLCDERLSGVEALSLIPGTVGAAPVQNIGAYGQELSETLVEVEAYDTEKQKLETLSNKHCKFGYRNSLFKTEKGRKFIIASIKLKLKKSRMSPPFYASLQKHFDAIGSKNYSPSAVRDAVISIRNQKLPDPSAIANTGSFFKNPIIKKPLYKKLKETYPDLPGYEVGGDLIKVPAGWLLERAGFKDYRHENGMGTYAMNALVFVNYSAHSYRDLAELKKQVQDKTKNMFGIDLEQEPDTY